MQDPEFNANILELYFKEDLSPKFFTFQTQHKGKIIQRSIFEIAFLFPDEISRPIRRKPRPPESNPDPRFPINNEIPDSANVQANEGPKADVPVIAVQNESKSRQQQLNLGKMK